MGFSVGLVLIKLLFDKVVAFITLLNGQLKIKGIEVPDPVETNYPDRLGQSDLTQTSVTSEPAGAIIKAEFNEQWGLSYIDTIHPNTLMAPVGTALDGRGVTVGPTQQPEHRMETHVTSSPFLSYSG